MRLAITLAILTSALACNFPPPIEHASSDFRTVLEGQEYILTYEGTHDVHQEEDSEVRLLVLLHHSGALTSVSDFDDMMDALEVAAEDRPDLHLRETTMVLSPAMIFEGHFTDNPDRYASGHYPWWWGGWRGGADSENSPTVSNFDLIDALILHVADRFPSLQAVVQVGHSAGGQLVNRYAVGSTVFDQLRERGIHMRSVTANPSSSLYFDRQRPDLSKDGGFIDYSMGNPELAGEPCADFNEYLYGLDGRYPYMRRRPLADMVAGFQGRDFWILSGEEDSDPEERSMDTSCPAAVQGSHRLDRGRRYYEYLGHFFGPDVYQSKGIAVIPGVGHWGGGIFASDQGRAIIFVDADSLAAHVRGKGGL